MKRKQTKKSKSKLLNVSKTHMLLFVVLFVLSAYVAFISYTAHSYWKMRNNDFSQTRSLIVEAIESMYKPAVIGPVEKKQYIYEASIRFDLPDKGQTFRYLYIPADKHTNESESIQLTTNKTLITGISNLGADKNMFDRVSDFQRCTKEFIIVFEEADLRDQLFAKIEEKKLVNGKTAHLHRNVSCNKIYRNNFIEHDKHELTLKTIESY